jgi:hypothetical protein
LANFDTETTILVASEAITITIVRTVFLQIELENSFHT